MFKVKSRSIKNMKIYATIIASLYDNFNSFFLSFELLLMLNVKLFPH